MKSQHRKRRIKLIKPRLQLRMVGAFFGLCALGLVAQTLVIGAVLMTFATEMPSGGTLLAEALPDLLAKTLLLSFALLVPALLLIGIRITFRVAGPLFRFERHLQEIASGEWPEPCTLRATDDLQEFCTLLNVALQRARNMGEEQRAEDGQEALAGADPDSLQGAESLAKGW